MVEEFLALFQTSLNGGVLSFALEALPLILAVLFTAVMLGIRLNFLRRTWIQEQGGTLLELRLPRDVHRSPESMEFVLNGLWENVTGSYADVYLKGRVRDWFSLEIVSHGGDVRFYIWCLPKWKDIVKTRIYAQYPGAEVYEVEDYARDVVFDYDNMKLSGTQWGLVKDDVYPMKSYIDFELHKTGQDEEQKVDPLNPVIEFLGSLKPGQHVWIQILIQAHATQSLDNAYVFTRPDYTKAVKEEIKKMIAKESVVKTKDDAPSTLLGLTQDQTDTIKAMERNAGKLAYDTMIRMIYFGNKDVYDGSNTMGLIGSFRQFASKNMNGLRPKWFAGFAHPWQDFMDRKQRYNQRSLIDSYKRRSFFNVPYKNWKSKPFVMSVEELATVYHIPSYAAAAAPALQRVPSKKSEAPSNLPI